MYLYTFDRVCYIEKQYAIYGSMKLQKYVNTNRTDRQLQYIPRIKAYIDWIDRCR